MSSSDSETCNDGKMLAAFDCGCPSERNTDPCELFPGGLEYPTILSNDADMTCGKLLGFVLSYSSYSDNCHNGKAIVTRNCGCPNTDPC